MTFQVNEPGYVSQWLLIISPVLKRKSQTSVHGLGHSHDLVYRSLHLASVIEESLNRLQGSQEARLLSLSLMPSDSHSGQICNPTHLPLSLIGEYFSLVTSHPSRLETVPVSPHLSNAKITRMPLLGRLKDCVLKVSCPSLKS